MCIAGMTMSSISYSAARSRSIALVVKHWADAARGTSNGFLRNNDTTVTRVVLSGGILIQRTTAWRTRHWYCSYFQLPGRIPSGAGNHGGGSICKEAMHVTDTRLSSTCRRLSSLPDDAAPDASFFHSGRIRHTRSCLRRISRRAYGVRRGSSRNSRDRRRN
jgi:hypothetical protein